jgi:hypothetical protein
VVIYLKIGGKAMKKTIALFLAFVLTVPVYVTVPLYAVEPEPVLEYASEGQNEMPANTVTESVASEHFAAHVSFSDPVDIALEKGLGQIVNEKIVTDDYTITIDGIVIEGNTLYMKAHAVSSEKYLIDENVYFMFHLEIFTNEEEINRRSVQQEAITDPVFEEIIQIISDEGLEFDNLQDFINYFEAAGFELPEYLMSPPSSVHGGSSSMSGSLGSVAVSNSQMRFVDDIEFEKLYIAVGRFEIVKQHELEFTLAELADGANDIFDEVTITQEGDKLIIETKIFDSQPHDIRRQMPSLNSLLVNGEYIWAYSGFGGSEESGFVSGFEYKIPDDAVLDFNEVKLTMQNPEVLFFETFGEDSTIIEIQIDQEKILPPGEEIVIDKTVRSVNGNIKINSIILNNFTFELIYMQTYETEDFPTSHIEVSEGVYKRIIEVRLANGDELYSIGGYGQGTGNNVMVFQDKYLLVDDVENIVITVLTHDNVYETIHLSDYID